MLMNDAVARHRPTVIAQLTSASWLKLCTTRRVGIMRDMFTGRHHRGLLFLRAFVCKIFAFALMLQPMLAAAAELHELAHDPTGGHLHSSHSVDVTEELTAVDETGDTAETLHTLLHFSHSCGETATEIPVVLPVAFAPMWHPVTSADIRMLGQPRLPTPFKPPISV